MRNVAWLMAAFLLFSVSTNVRAEGGCPPGQYPIGGQGVQGCAPIPGAAGAQPAAPAPTGKWLDRWGALATSADASVGGGVFERKTKREAVSAALKLCKDSGGQGCKLYHSYKNSCVAVAKAVDGLGQVATSGSIAQASQMGMAACTEGGGQCSVVYSACSLPEYMSY